MTSDRAVGSTLHADIHEPRELLDLIGQAAPTTVRNLNAEGYADYWWLGQDGEHQIERKTWSDLLTSLGQVEEQLRRQVDAHKNTKLALLVEGMAVPSDELRGGTAMLHHAKGNPSIYYRRHQSKITLKTVYAWLYQVSKYMEVYQTSDMLATAHALVAFYGSDQKRQHGTLRRHLKEVTFHPNSQVTALMGLMHGLGPVKGEALVAKFGTVWQVVNASPQELARVHEVNIGEATRWLQRIGRPDV